MLVGVLGLAIWGSLALTLFFLTLRRGRGPVHIRRQLAPRSLAIPLGLLAVMMRLGRLGFLVEVYEEGHLFDNG